MKEEDVSVAEESIQKDPSVSGSTGDQLLQVEVEASVETCSANTTLGNNTHVCANIYTTTWARVHLHTHTKTSFPTSPPGGLSGNDSFTIAIETSYHYTDVFHEKSFPEMLTNQ